MATAQTPGDVGRLAGEAITAKDMDVMLSLYEPDGVFVMPKGFGEGAVTGTDALRGAFQAFMDMDPELQVNAESTFTSGDTALVIGNWTLAFTGPDGERSEAQGRYADVVRSQDDGNWLFVIDNPNGSD